MSIAIEMAVLEKACKEVIETILFCLPNAFKGTIYTVGKPPDLIAKRVTSGVVEEARSRISWGLPEKSGYNPPGMPWLAYRDEPNRPHEAMAWCVERQKSWTAEDPENDSRSVRLQVEGVYEDFHHMEPVFVRKSDLNYDMYTTPEYPRNDKGEMIWQDSEYVIVAVIKIHFRPFTIRIGSHETKVIKKLSRSLGTQLLSYQLRQDSMKAMEELARDRLSACNILADSLRNAITKSGVVFSLIKKEISTLRRQWEQILREEFKEKDQKKESIEDLNQILLEMGDEYKDFSRDLIDIQNRFLDLYLPPQKGENWLNMRIKERWNELLSTYPQDDQRTKRIWENIDRLRKSLHFGQNPEVIANYKKMPQDLKWEWVDLIYGNYDSYDAFHVEKLINILKKPELCIPSHEKSYKSLIQLKALAETMNHLERSTNFLLHQVLNGNKKGLNPSFINSIKKES